MERYEPVKELPEDIQGLPREETVCQFCGVSYLVHHEIAKLENKIQQLEREIKRLQYIETDKASWEEERNSWQQERAKLIKDRDVVATERDVVATERDRLAKEVGGLHTKLDYRQTELHQLKQKQESELKSYKVYQTRVWHNLSKILAEVTALRHFKTEVSQLLTGTGDSLSQLSAEVTQACSNKLHHTKQAVSGLQSERERLQRQMRAQNEKWALTKDNLNQLLQEEKKSALKYKQENESLIGKAKRVETVLATREEEIQKMRQKLELCKSEVQATAKATSVQRSKVNQRVCELESEVKAMKLSRAAVQTTLDHTLGELKTVELSRAAVQAALDHTLGQLKTVELSRAAVQAALEHTLGELKTLTHTHKELQSSLASSRNELKSSHKKMEALKVQQSQELEAVRKETQSKLNTAYRASWTERDQLKSTLTACELEKARLVSSLQEQLQKEKDIADRELTDHLNSVKLLELSLLQEQRAGKGAGEKAAVETAEVKKNFESAEKTKTALEAKLAEAYQEIGVLQTIVERECEERERLTEQLTLARPAAAHSKRTY